VWPVGLTSIKLEAANNSTGTNGFRPFQIRTLKRDSSATAQKKWTGRSPSNEIFLVKNRQPHSTATSHHLTD